MALVTICSAASSVSCSPWMSFQKDWNSSMVIVVARMAAARSVLSMSMSVTLLISPRMTLLLVALAQIASNSGLHGKNIENSCEYNWTPKELYVLCGLPTFV